MDKNTKIGVVGLGLIGGSILKSLCAQKLQIYGVTKSASTIQKAKNYCKNVSDSLESLKDCDIVFVCVHMNKTKEILSQLEKVVSSKTVVSDVCSLKSFIAEDKYSFKFIPTHPMAGTEFSGFDNSFENLFSGAKWVLTPFEKTLKDDIEKIVDVVKLLDAIPVFATPQAHDEAVALISHMPMLVAQAIFKTASQNELAIKLASSGFRDMTRLALSNSEMAADMVKLNSNNIQNSTLKLYSSIGDLLGEKYFEQAQNIKDKRCSMYVNGKNIL